MKGTYHITVQNRSLKYEFDIRRNLTLIQGDSATGKTTLIDLIREYHMDKKSGINLSCSRPCRVLEGDLWKEQIQFINDSILFIDEGSSFVETEDFASAAKNSSNYFVIVTRANLEMLPVSVEEVYGIRSSGKYNSFEPVYHEMYRIYSTDISSDNIPFHPEKILVEDSNSGYEFFCDIAKKNNIECESAGGKSNIYTKLSERKSDEKLLVIADGAAFASQMNRISRIASLKNNISLYLPESFEWLILASKVMDDKETAEIIYDPSEYIDSTDYFSWERFFTGLLINKTQNTYLQYSKSKLNPNYLQDNTEKKILDYMESIKFDKTEK